MPKCAIITGAASGMGRIYATRLAREGYIVIAVDRNADELGRLCSENTDCIPCLVDLCSENAVAQITDCIIESCCEPEILINNAGMLLTGGICRTEPSTLKNIITLHCITPLLLCRAIIPLMKDGYILNISSICAWMSWPAIGMYSNTKRFIKDYSRSLRIEMESGIPIKQTGNKENCPSVNKRRISVTTAIFGAVDTDLFYFPPKIKSLLRHCGFMISPERAVDMALKAMFNRRRKVIPGLMTKLSIPFIRIVPDCFLRQLYQKYGLSIER